MELLLGTAQFSGNYGALGTPAVSDASALLEVVGSVGIRALDTAPVYGAAERMIGQTGWAGDIHTKFANVFEAEIGRNY
jgi:aryl-alcohol dehydrogenase-like predicted oxidoreductase